MFRTGEARRSRILLLWLCLYSLAVALSGCLDSSGESPDPPGPQPPTAVNLPPTANAGTDQLVLTGASVNLAGSGTDSDGTVTTYAWSQTGGGAVTLANANTASASFTAPATAGDLTFQLFVTDNAGATRTDSIVISVNAAPTANAGSDQTVSAAMTVTLNGSATDANGTIATYAWTQLSGTAVTLSSASVAAPTFAAPGGPTTLEFRLAVTDDQGATHFDLVTVNVVALTAPVIVRDPANTIAHEHGAALMFVVARGENLNYEWRSVTSDTVIKSGPEPFLMRGTGAGLGMSNDGDCFRVIVSNAAGSLTSANACLTIIEAEYALDPTDELTGDDYDFAWGYGSTLMGIVQTAAGSLTGAVTLENSGVPRFVEAPHSCYSGQFIGATLDGYPVTTTALLPLGQHTVSWHWGACRYDGDTPARQVGAMLISYNFPDVFGVGTYTMQFSGFGLDEGVYNGAVDVTTTRTANPNGNIDETVVTLQEDFCAGSMREDSASNRVLHLERRFNVDGNYIDDAYLDFDMSLAAFDEDGYAGLMYDGDDSTLLHLHEQPGTGDNNDPTHTATGRMVVRVSIGVPASESFELATLLPVGGHSGWDFEPEMPEEED